MDLQRAIDEIFRGLGEFLVQRPLEAFGGPQELAIITAFREAGAVTPRRAQRFHAHSVLDEAAFNRLLHAGVIRRAKAGRYYLHERALPRKEPIDLRALDDLIDDNPMRK